MKMAHASHFLCESITKLSLVGYREKYEERDLHSRCMIELGLYALEKADNVTPSLMIDCLNRLL